LSCEVS